MTKRVQVGTVAAVLAALGAGTATAQLPGDWQAVGAAVGKPGTLQLDGVYKVALPRADLRVVDDGIVIRPALALGSWIAFKQTSDSTVIMMGDLALLEREIGPVREQLAAAHIEVTALHNHLANESPRIMYMHVAGRGDPATLAASIHAALLVTGTPLGASGAPRPLSMTLDTAEVGRVLGYHGKVNGGVYQVSAARVDPITVDGIPIPASMGVATAINFQPIGPDRAAVTGDFALITAEVGPVVRALASHAIAVTAIHSHMLDDVPHLFFVHFWGIGGPRDLASGLRAALDRVNLRTAAP